MLRVGRLLTFVFIFAVAGGHWGVMQVATWADMASGSESGSLIEAVFGDPCENCLAICAGSQEDKNDPKSASNAKLDVLAAGEISGVRIFPPEVMIQFADAPLPLSGIRIAPPHGPPRPC